MRNRRCAFPPPGVGENQHLYSGMLILIEFEKLICFHIRIFYFFQFSLALRVAYLQGCCLWKCACHPNVNNRYKMEAMKTNTYLHQKFLKDILLAHFTRIEFKHFTFMSQDCPFPLKKKYILMSI